ncbi:MAG: ABC transporter permease [Actinobacteria bacterium]|nr:ABC transporter permease [Actinomycetota bacterium]
MAFLHGVATGHSQVKNALKGRSLTPYLLLAPGLIWLITFFIIPIFSLASTSTVLPFIDDLFRINNTSTAVVIGLAYNFLPFMTLPLYASLERIDPRTLEAAGDLYANGLTTFRKVTLPLSMPGVVAGTLLTFIPAAGDYVNAAILGNPSTKMIGNVIESRFFAVVDYPTAAALSFTLMATILILVSLYIRKSGTDELV